MNEFTQRFLELPENPTNEQIEQTASTLEGYHWEPVMILKAPNFVRWRKEDMIKEKERLLSLDPTTDTEISAVLNCSSDEVVQKHLSMLLYHYEILHRLRLGESEAWDIVFELYEDD